MTAGSAQRNGGGRRWTPALLALVTVAVVTAGVWMLLRPDTTAGLPPPLAVLRGRVLGLDGVTPYADADVRIEGSEGQVIAATITDAAGRFDAPELPSSHALVLSVETVAGSSALASGIVLDAFEDRSLGTLRLGPRADIRCTVRGRAGEPVSRALLTLHRRVLRRQLHRDRTAAAFWFEPAPLAERFTDDAGLASFADTRLDDWVLRVEAEGFATGWLPVCSGDGGGGNVSYEIVLEPAQVLTGRVRDGAGAARVGVQVVALPLGQDAWGFERVAASRATTGSDGRFRLQGLPPGSVAVWARDARDGVPHYVGVVSVPEVDDLPIALTPVLEVGGRVRSADAPLAGAVVRAWLPPRHGVATWMESRTDDDGRYALAIPAGSGECELSLVSPHHGVTDAPSVELSTGADVRLDLRATPLAMIAGALSHDSVPLKHAAVRVRRASGLGGGSTLLTAHTDSRGALRIAVPAGGSYELEVTAPAFAPQTVDLEVPRAAAGGTEGPSVQAPPTLTLDRCTDVSGLVLDSVGNPVRGARVRATANWHDSFVFTGADGQFSLSGAAGFCRVAATGAHARDLLARRDLRAGQRRDAVTLRTVESRSLTVSPGDVAPGTPGLVALVWEIHRPGSPAYVSEWRTAVRDVANLTVPAPSWARAYRAWTWLTDGSVASTGRTTLPGPSAAWTRSPSHTLSGSMQTIGSAEGVGDALIEIRADDAAASPPAGEVLRPWAAPAVVTVSAADGSFRVPGLPAGPYVVRARAPGLPAASERVTVHGDVDVRLAVARPLSVSGTVRFSDGVRAVGVRVVGSQAGSGTPRRSTASTDERGRFTLGGLHAGEVRIHVLPTERGNVIPSRRDGVPAGSERVQLTVRRAVSIRGTVRTSDGRHVENARVSLTAPEEPHEGRYLPQVETDGHGRFNVPGLEATAYHVSVLAEGYAPRTVRGVVAGGADVEVVLDPGHRLEGRLLLRSGEPAVQWWLRVRRGDESVAVHSRTDDDGRFTVGGLASGEYRVEVARDRRRGRWELLPDVLTVQDATETELRVPGPAHVTGRVTDEAGRPVSGARVVATPTHSREEVVRTQTAADGTYTLEGVAAGTRYTFSVDHESFLPGRVVAVTDGATLPDVVLARGRTCSGTLLRDGGDAAAGLRLLFVHAATRAERRTTTAVDGSFEARRLAPGELEVYLESDGEAGRTRRLVGSVEAGAVGVTLRLP